MSGENSSGGFSGQAEAEAGKREERAGPRERRGGRQVRASEASPGLMAALEVTQLSWEP